MVKRHWILMILMVTVFRRLPAEASSPFLLFGPKEYVRTTGGSNEFTESFENCEGQSQYKLVVENGNADGTDRISSGIVHLNGIEVIRRNEFNHQVGTIEKPIAALSHNTLEVRLSSKPGGFITLRIECVANCLGLHFITPVAQSDVNAPHILAHGLVTSSSEQVGVVVNGAPAFIYQDRFVVNRIPIALGANTLVGAVTNACGMRAEEIISIQATEIKEAPVQIIPFPTSGIVPFSTTLTSLTHLLNRIAKYQWDFDGDGFVDQEGEALSEVIHLYNQPGFYLPKLTVHDIQGKRHSDQIGIVVMTLEELDRLLTAKWEEMKGRLSQKDIEGAMQYFAAGSSKEMFRKNFTLMSEILPQIVSEMGPIAFDRVAGNGDVAFYSMEGIQGGVRRSFQIQFQKDQDGIWKIKFF